MRYLKFLIISFCALFLVFFLAFAYVRNNVCQTGWQLVKTESDAVSAAKRVILEKPLFNKAELSGSKGIIDLLNATPSDCCKATRSRNLSLITVWHVEMNVKKDGTSMDMMLDLTNCGYLVAETAYASN